MRYDPRFILDPACPWGELRLLTGTPDILWCEKQICSWIANPVNTWTNAAYVVTALALFILNRRERSANLRFYSIAIACVGLTSFVYHASLAFPTQLLDFFGMYLFLFFLIAQNLARVQVLAETSVRTTAWLGAFLCTAFAAIGARFGMPLQPTVMLLIAVFLISEAFAAKKAKGTVPYKHFTVSVALLGVGAVFSAADVTGRVCDPRSLFQGHAIWHILSAGSLFFSYLHARPLYSRETGNLTRG